MCKLEDYNSTVQCMSVKPDSIVFYSKFIGERFKTQKFVDNQIHLKDNKSNGTMSGKKQSRAKAILTNWLQCSNEKSINNLGISGLQAKNHTFVTLTLPCEQLNTDIEIKRKCLSPFIQRVVNEYGVKHYYWKAEAQKNGNIHFHVIFDKFVSWLVIRKLWNLQLDKLGYITKYSENQKEFYSNGFKMSANVLDVRSYDVQYNAYKKNKENGFLDPNSIDVHSFRDIRNVAAYVVKYMCKEEGYRKIVGRLHGYSDGIGFLNNFKIEADRHVNRLRDTLIKDASVKCLLKERCAIYIVDSVSYLKNKSSFILNKLKDFVSGNYNKLYGTVIEVVEEIVKPVEYHLVSKLVQLDLFINN